MSNLLVCYLVAPGLEYDLYAHRFLESYNHYSAGIDHDALFVVKEGAQAPTSQTFTSISHPNESHDIWSLQAVCLQHMACDRIMWLGSSCQILADDWLAKIYAASKAPGVGAVATSGSYEKGISSYPHNPHLRSSALLLSPYVVLTFGFGSADTRQDAYEFEHGDNSLYRRLHAHGMSGVVVGADGKSYYESDWPESHTYRKGEQENLLIADKQTDAYQSAGPEDREVLSRMAGWLP